MKKLYVRTLQNFFGEEFTVTGTKVSLPIPVNKFRAYRFEDCVQGILLCRLIDDTLLNSKGVRSISIVHMGLPRKTIRYVICSGGKHFGSSKHPLTARLDALVSYLKMSIPSMKPNLP